MERMKCRCGCGEETRGRYYDSRSKRWRIAEYVRFHTPGRGFTRDECSMGGRLSAGPKFVDARPVQRLLSGRSVGELVDVLGVDRMTVKHYLRTPRMRPEVAERILRRLAGLPAEANWWERKQTDFRLECRERERVALERKRQRAS